MPRRTDAPILGDDECERFVATICCEQKFLHRSPCCLQPVVYSHGQDRLAKLQHLDHIIRYRFKQTHTNAVRSSIVGWLSLAPLIWWPTGRLRPPRFRWSIIAVAALLGSVLASTWHILVMVALRHVYYATTGEGPYRFFGVIGDRIAYEYRKDLVTFVQFVAIALAVRWMIDRQADAPASTPAAPSTEAPRHLVVTDGPTRISVPIHEIDSVASAGNYVELAWTGRTLLHRATLAGMEEELGDGFVRVHRGLIVRADAIRTVEVERSGDFAIGLASGATVRGSRRYRDSLRRWSGDAA